MSILKSFWTEFQPHPFRVLLSLEWLLLGTIAVMIPIETLGWVSLSQLWFPIDQSLVNPVKMTLLVVTFVIFGLLGLRLPTQHLSKMLYIAIEFGLFGFACFLLNWNSSRSIALLVIVMIRNCLLFSGRGRWWMLAVTSLVYLIAQLPAGFLVAIALFGISPAQLAAIQGNWGHEWGQIFPDGRAVLNLNLQLQPEQVKTILSGIRGVVIQFYATEFITFALMILFVVLLVNALLAERQGRKKLAIAHEQLYQYSRQIEDQSALQERNRIARDLHDSLGHLLTAQNIQLQNAALHLHHQPESSQTFLMSATNMGTQALTELRHTLNQLRNDPLEGRSLNQAIDDLIQSFQRMTSIGLLCDIQIAEPIPNRIQVAIYRIIEESLMNAYKHSNAQQIQIQINDRNSTLILTIEDNGQGFEINQIPTGFGLRGMRERAEGVGGILTIVSQIHQGCRLQLTIPVLQE